jgi:sugar lactone lactonase YvrE
VARGFGGRYFVTLMNGRAEGDGAVKVLDDDRKGARDFARDLEDPQGICFTGKLLMVVDVKRVWRVDAHGGKSPLVDEDDFPRPPAHLQDVAWEPGGKAVFVTEAGSQDPPIDGLVYRIGFNYKISVAIDSRADMRSPSAILAPAPGRLLVATLEGTVLEARGKSVKTLATGLTGACGLAEDARGTVYVSSSREGKIWSLPRPSPSGGKPAEPVVVAEGLRGPADLFHDRATGALVVPELEAGTVRFIRPPSPARAATPKPER